MVRVRRTGETVYARLGQGAPLAVFVAAGLLVAYKLLPVLELVAIAMLVAVVFRSISRALERLKLPPWSTPFALLGVIALFGTFVWLVIVPNLVQEAQTLISNFPRYVDSLTNLARDLPYIADLSRMGESLKRLFSQAVGSLSSVAMKLLSLAGAAVAGLLLAVYMSVDPRPLVGGALRLVPREKRDKATRFLRTFESRLRGWMVGQAIVALFVGIGGGLGLWIIGIPLYISFGLVAGVLNVVPYLGSIVGAMLPALLALTISPVKSLLVVALFVALNQVEGYVLQPMVMGREAKLHPAMVIISFLIFGALLGLAGALLAVPAAVLCATLMDELFPDEAFQKDRDPRG